MNTDPLQKLWQSNQLNIPVDKILQQAKARQKRMFWLLLTDIVTGVGLIIWALFYVHNNEKTFALPLAIFIVVTVLFYLGISIWKRATTWGLDTLDVKNTLRLNIRRCQAGVQLGYLSTLVCGLFFFGVLLLFQFGPELPFTSKLFAISWTGGWTLIIGIWTLWYKQRQAKKVRHYQALLQQLEEHTAE